MKTMFTEFQFGRRLHRRKVFPLVKSIFN